MTQITTPKEAMFEAATSEAATFNTAISDAFAPQGANTRGVQASVTSHHEDPRLGHRVVSVVVPSTEAVIVPLRDPAKAFDPSEVIIEAIARELTRRCGGNHVLNRMEAAAQFLKWLSDVQAASNATHSLPSKLD
jgi:hypothetical protein